MRCTMPQIVGGGGGQCDDGNPCTIDWCNNTYCEHEPNDGALCRRSTNACIRYRCEGTPCSTIRLSGGPCLDDYNECTDDVCVNGTCAHQPLTGIGCTVDGDGCTADYCIRGVCEHPPRDRAACNDGNPCTTDGCDSATGMCTHTPVGGACDDGNPCTHGDACSAGHCAGTPDPNCYCPYNYRVDGGGTAEGVMYEQTVRFTIPEGTEVVAVLAEFFSREYPAYTGDASEFNDHVSFSVSTPGGTVLSDSANVNDLHGLWSAGLRPGGFALIDFSSFTQNGPSWIETTGSAMNVGNGRYGSGVRFPRTSKFHWRHCDGPVKPDTLPDAR